MNNSYILISIAIMTAVTVTIRSSAFIFFAGKQTPKVVLYLGKVLPSAIIGMLCVYCLKDVNIFNVSSLLPTLIASLFVVGSYIWKKNVLLSIFLGTVLYMLLLQGIS